MTHWSDDGYIIAIPVVLIWYPFMAWVLIFRPEWANKVNPFFQITPQWGKVLGGIVLLGMAQALSDIADHFIRGSHP